MLSFSSAVGQYNHTDSETLEDAVDTVASQCGDPQRDRDRSGLTLWQVSVETNETDGSGLTLWQVSVETSLTETEGETETRPSSFFKRPARR